jgi:hypothetical protein
MPAPEPRIVVFLDEADIRYDDVHAEETVYAKPIAYGCPTCGQLYGPRWHPACNEDTPEKKDAKARESAVRCCYHHCPDCDALMPPKPYYYIYCPDCCAKREAAKEAAQYAKAKKVPEAEYDGGYVYWEGHGSGEGFFETIDELRDYGVSNHIALPSYVYACATHKIPKLDAEDIVSNLLADGEAYEDAIDDMDINCLQKLLDFWLEYNQKNCYTPDHGTVVLLSEEANRKYVEQAALDDAEWQKDEAARARQTMPTIPPVPAAPTPTTEDPDAHQ